MYLAIEKVVMATETDVYEIVYDTGPVEDIRSGGYCVDDYIDAGIFRTKKEAMYFSGYAPVSGYWAYSGKRLWQLPVKVRDEIRKMIKEREL